MLHNVRCKIVPGGVKVSRPCGPGVVVPGLGVGGGVVVLGRLRGAGGNDDAELAKPPCIKNCWL